MARLCAARIAFMAELVPGSGATTKPASCNDNRTTRAGESQEGGVKAREREEGLRMVLRAGLEPARHKPYAPQAYVSTNSTT